MEDRSTLRQREVVTVQSLKGAHSVAVRFFEPARVFVSLVSFVSSVCLFTYVCLFAYAWLFLFLCLFEFFNYNYEHFCCFFLFIYLSICLFVLVLIEKV